MIEIQIFDNSMVEQIPTDLPYLLIEIVDSNHEMMLNTSDKHCVKKVTLWFDDIDQVQTEKIAFHFYHARQILCAAFDTNIDYQRIVVYCSGKMRRSSAIAAALDKMINDVTVDWFHLYCPNKMVYQVLLESAVDLGLWDPNVLV